MEFRVLGPVVGTAESRELKLGGPKQRLVLAMLIVARGDSVSMGALMEGLWQNAAPATARKTLQGYVHHLRSEIGEALQTDNSGYSLNLREDQVDDRRFSALALQARELIDVDLVSVSQLLTEALALWRGSPYADLDGELALRPEITRLEELRMVALGDRIDADLALGQNATLIGELQSLTADNPLRERFQRQHMLALYRAGRHGEALRAFARTRDCFVEEMGIEPSDQLRALEERILARDSSLDLDVEGRSASPHAVRGYELREMISSEESGATVYRGYQRSVGREVAIRCIDAEQANAASFMARYQADTARIARVNHPNVLYVQDTWREPGRVYQVMQWIEGTRLDVYLQENQPPISRALKILQQLADALTAAHRDDVVHGALDAQAVLVSPTGEAYLTNFVVGRPAGSVADDCIAFARVADLLLTGARPEMTVTGYRRTMSDRGPPALTDVFEAAFDRSALCKPADLMRGVRRALGLDVVGIASNDPATRSEIRNPYKGLQAFQLTDASDFFGRNKVVDRLINVLEEHRVVAVVGPSGSGKSSVVKAGLEARLEARDEPVLVAEMYPGSYPFEALEAALQPVAVTSIHMSDALVASRRGLANVLTTILPNDGSEVVLIIDQFEELFSMVGSEAVRSLFLDSLVDAVRAPSSRLRVVVTLRADFFDRPLRYPEFGALVEAGLVPLTMPDKVGLASAIERPAAAVGIAIEPGLTQEILRDVAGQPGGLPLLQYAMTELFDQRETDLLTLQSYRSSGGVLGALAARAEGLFHELDPAGRSAVRQAFMRLVTVDEGAHDVRRRVGRSELLALEVDRAALNRGLQLFGAHRLLTFDADPVSRNPTIEVAHEALLREWDRLRNWIDDERDHLVSRRRLGAALGEWRDAAEDPGYLLTGARLARFDEWAEATELALSNDERSFLEISRVADSATARRTTVLRRRVTIGLIVAAVAASAFGLYALAQRSEIADQAYLAETERLGNQAGFVSEWNHQLALLMAVETYQRDPGFEGLNALQRVLVDAGPFLGMVGAGEDFRDVVWVTDERLVAVSPSAVHLLDVVTAERIDLSQDLTVSPSGGLLASSPAGIATIADAAGDVWILDARSGEVDSFPAARNSSAIALSEDGTLLAAGFADGRIAVFDIDGGSRRAAINANQHGPLGGIQLQEGVLIADGATYIFEGVTQLEFDSTGERLLSANGAAMRVWNVPELTPRGPEMVHASGLDNLNQYVREPRDMWFDEIEPDVVVVADESFVVRWNGSTGKRVSITSVASDDREATRSIAASVSATDGRALALTTTGRVVRLEAEDLNGEAIDPDIRESFVFETQQSETRALAIDPAGERFAVASAEGIVIGAHDGRQLLSNRRPIAGALRPSLSNDGQTLAAGLASNGIYDLTASPASRFGFDPNVEIADVAGSAATLEFVASTQRDIVIWTSGFVGMANAYDYDDGGFIVDVWGSFAPAWNDDGTLVARVSPSGGTVVEDLETNQILFEAPAMLRAADFDTSGSRVLMSFLQEQPGSSDYAFPSAQLIDLNNGTQTALPMMPGGAFSAAFTPDDEQIVMIGADGAAWVLDDQGVDVLRQLQDAEVSTDLRARPPTFSADGQWMFSGADGRARVWHFPSGLQLGKPFPNQAGSRPSAVGDGPSLQLVTPHDGSALVWNLDVDSWVGLACQAAGRNMTLPEWNRYGPSDTEYRATCPQHTPEEE